MVEVAIKRVEQFVEYKNKSAVSSQSTGRMLRSKTRKKRIIYSIFKKDSSLNKYDTSNIETTDTNNALYSEHLLVDHTTNVVSCGDRNDNTQRTNGGEAIQAICFHPSVFSK